VITLPVAVAARRRPGEPARAVRAVASATTHVLLVMREVGVTPGFWLLRLERRERASGRRPGTARATVTVVLEQLPRVAASRATAAARERHREQTSDELRERAEALRALSARHDGDRDAFQRAARELPLAGGLSWRIFAAQVLVAMTLRRAVAPLSRRVSGDVITVAIRRRG
jgi:hypothetical protein